MSSLNRYTIFVSWDGGKSIDEEIDIDAANEIQARNIAEELLKTDYEPGGKIIEIQERFGLYW